MVSSGGFSCARTDRETIPQVDRIVGGLGGLPVDRFVTRLQ
jgi:hypothetical protein